MGRRYWMYRYDPEYWEAVMPYSIAAIVIHIVCNWILGRIHKYTKEHPYLPAEMKTFYDLVYIGIWLLYIVLEIVVIWQVIQNVWFGGA